VEKVQENFYSSSLAGLAELRAAKPELEEIIEFYEAVLVAQRDVKLLYRPDLSKLDIERCHKRNSEGLPILKPEDIQIDKDLFNGLLNDISRIIQSKKKEAIPVTLKHFPLDKQCTLLLRGLMEDKSLLEQVAREMKADFGVFCFLITEVFSPFLGSYAEKTGELVDSSCRLRGACPICGSEPLAARLEKESGKRRLFCSLCHTEWLFKRLACPFCENEEQRSLRYFFAGDDQAHRIDVCDKCKRYIKTIDSRKTDSVMNLFVENLSTLALDIVADKEGFRGGNAAHRLIPS
jgi:FdhE protein